MLTYGVQLNFGNGVHVFIKILIYTLFNHIKYVTI